MDDPYELVYAEAVRALGVRRDALESLRSRAGVVLSAAAIASSLFGSQTVRTGLGIFGWIAVLAFLGLSWALLLILWPRNDWQDTSLPSRVLAKGIEVDEPLPIALIRRDLALEMERVYLTNTDSYVRLARSFRAAAMLLNLEVLAWILAIATGA